MSQENVEIARRASHAWNEGGVEAILPYLDPEVEWHAPKGVDGARDLSWARRGA